MSDHRAAPVARSRGGLASWRLGGWSLAARCARHAGTQHGRWRMSGVRACGRSQLSKHGVRHVSWTRPAGMIAFWDAELPLRYAGRSPKQDNLFSFRDKQ